MNIPNLTPSMVAGSSSISMQSLRESSDNSEFEIVDFVSSRFGSANHKRSAVCVLSPAVQSPMPLTAKSVVQTLAQNEPKKQSNDEQITQCPPVNVWMENQQLRTELAEAKAHIVVLRKELEAYRKSRTDGGNVGKAIENLRTTDETSTESQRRKNNSKAVMTLLQESKSERSNNAIGDQFVSAKDKDLSQAIPMHTIAQTFPRTQHSDKSAFWVRSASSPPLPKLLPPRNLADAQLLDLLGDVQPVRDANRPAAPPPKKSAVCKVCGQWLCNSYFLRAHIQSQHCDDRTNGLKRGKTQNALDNFEKLIDVSGQSSSAPKMAVSPKTIRPVPNDTFRIKWDEEEVAETDEEQNSKDEFSWNLIGEVPNGRADGMKNGNGKDKPKRGPSDELGNYEGLPHRQHVDLMPHIGRSAAADCVLLPAYSAISPSMAAHFRPLSRDGNQKQHVYSSSSSSPSDSALSSSTASSLMSSTNNTSEDEAQSHDHRRKGKVQDQNEKESVTGLDECVLNRLLYIEPPNAKKQKLLNNNTCSKATAPLPIVSCQNNSCAGQILGNSFGEKPKGSQFAPIDTSVPVQSMMQGLDNDLQTMRSDFRTLKIRQEQNDQRTDQRLDILGHRMCELDVKLGEFDVETGRVRDEQKTQLDSLMRENGRMRGEFVEHQKGMEAVQSQIALLEHCLLREFVKGLPSAREDGSLVLSHHEMGNYCAEMKLLFRLGSQFYSGLAIRGSANFRNYPSDLFDQLIEHALTTRDVPKIVRWIVLNFPTNERVQWPQAFLLDANCTAANDSDNNKMRIYRNLIRRRAVLPDRVVYSLHNQHSSHKFVANIYYSSASELFQQMHCFTIRLRPPR